jgi:hypothetical protein
MSRRVNESARVLNFFRVADLGKAEVLYDLVRETMEQRLAPAKAAKKAAAKKRAPKGGTVASSGVSSTETMEKTGLSVRR